jgi:glycosyltransferase involved in cell wall biosynthesis
MTAHSGDHVLLVTDTWHPQVNGVITVIDHLIDELKQRGIAADVLSPNDFFSLPFPLYPEFQLALFPKKSIVPLLRGGKYTDVHILTYGPVAWYARAACKRIKLPFSMSFHNQIHLYAEVRFGRWARRLTERLIHWFYAPAALTLATTPSALKELRMFGLDKLDLWHLGVDERFFTRDICPRPLEKPVFMFVGRLAPEKNVEEFLAAKLPGTKLVIGDGPDRRKLESRHPEAVFLGYKTGKELVAWMSGADVLVMPSRTETLGLVILEALALGIPVAAHDVTGPRDIIENGVTGFLDEDLARAARHCLELSPEKCQETARRYSWKASTESFFALISSVRR